MKHTAKKVYAGCYIYRGYDIERMEDGHWNLKMKVQIFGPMGVLH